MLESKSSDSPLSICYIDVNKLKNTNDTHGHFEGDYLLKTIGEILKKCVREEDQILRLGGDEFLLILPECDLKGAEKVWERVERAITEKNSQHDKPYSISISHGFALLGSEKIPLDQFIAMADAAMYANKREQTS